MAADPHGRRGGDGIDSPVRLAIPIRGSPSGGRAADEEEPADDRPPPESGETVTCPECGADNDPEYRYCRDCVAELPGSDEIVGGPTGDGLL